MAKSASPGEGDESPDKKKRNIRQERALIDAHQDWVDFRAMPPGADMKHMRSEYGLGPRLRLRIIRALATVSTADDSLMENDAFFAACLAAAKKAGLTVPSRGRLSDGLSRSKGAVNADAFAAAVAWLRTTLEGFTPSAHEVMTKPFDGPYAVEAFWNWIRGFGLAPGSNTTLLTEKRSLLNKSKREEAMATVTGFLLDREGPPGEPFRTGPGTEDAEIDYSPLVMAVSGPGSPEGLRAFAVDIWKWAEAAELERWTAQQTKLIEDKDKRRSARAVPGGGIALNPARAVCVLPVSRDADTNEAVSSALLIGRLRAFCEGATDLKAAPAPRNPTERRQAIEVIRRTLARHPAILVLDCWASVSGPTSRLDSVIDDDGLVELLAELRQPWLGPDAAKIDPSAFWRNRIVVLTESRTLPPSKDLPAKIVPLPPLDPNGVGILARSHRWRADRLIEIARASTTDPEASTAPPDDPRRKAQDDRDLLLTDTGLLVLNGLLGKSGEPERPTELAAAGFRLAVREWFEGQATEALSTVILSILALTRDGMRRSTLRRLLRQFAAISRDAPGSWRLAGVDIENALPTALATLIESRVAVAGFDSPIAGLDDLPSGDTYDDDPLYADLKAEDRKRADRSYIDLESQLLRTTLAGLLTNPEIAPPKMLARLHRLLSEESIQQYSLICAQDPSSEEVVDAHTYRRLTQGLFHGYASLAMGEARDEEGAIARRTLPAQPDEAFRRLYAVFYRSLIERPPNWELSRSMGREDLKTDLLALALRAGHGAGESWAPLYGDAVPQLPIPISPDLGGPAFLGDKARDLRILLDQYMALARACFHADDRSSAEESLGAASRVLKKLDGAYSHRVGVIWAADLMGEAIDIAKIRCDLKIMETHDADELEAFTREQLIKAEFPSAMLDQLVSATADRRPSELDEVLKALTSQVTADALRAVKRPRQADANQLAQPDENPEDLSEEAVAAALEEPRIADRVSTLLAGWSDLLCRYGEARAQPTIGSNNARKARGLLLAFNLLYAAERIRRNAFNFSPLRRDFYINAHSTRVLIRIALDIVDLSANYHKEPNAGARPDWLTNVEFVGDQAGRHLRMLQRYLARYPTEKPSLLILAATYARTYGETGTPDLIRAEALIDRADSLMSTTAHRPRVRVRFLLERSRIYEARLEAIQELEKARRRQGLIRSENHRELVDKMRLATALDIDSRRLRTAARASKIIMWERFATERETAAKAFSLFAAR